MNYVVTFEYPYKPADDEETAIAFKVFDSFNAKKPDLPQVKIHAYFGRLDGHGGFVVVETDEPPALLRIALMFQPFFEYYIYPVVDIQDFASVSREVNQEIRSIRASHNADKAPKDATTP